MTLREIRSNCGNPQSPALHISMLNSPGLFLDFSWVTRNSHLAAQREQLHPQEARDSLAKSSSAGGQLLQLGHRLRPEAPVYPSRNPVPKCRRKSTQACCAGDDRQAVAL